MIRDPARHQTFLGLGKRVYPQAILRYFDPNKQDSPATRRGGMEQVNSPANILASAIA